VVEQPGTQIIDVVDPLPNIGVWDEAQPCLELVESSVNRERCTHPATDLLVDVLQERRIVEEQQVRREDEGVFLIDLARRRGLNSRNIIVRLRDRGSHARTLRSGVACGQVPRGEIESVSAAKHGKPDRDAGRCAHATQRPLPIARRCGQGSWCGLGHGWVASIESVDDARVLDDTDELCAYRRERPDVLRREIASHGALQHECAHHVVAEEHGGREERRRLSADGRDAPLRGHLSSDGRRFRVRAWAPRGRMGAVGGASDEIPMLVE
jgi:hypothetical protein